MLYASPDHLLHAHNLPHLALDHPFVAHDRRHGDKEVLQHFLVEPVDPIFQRTHGHVTGSIGYTTETSLEVLTPSPELVPALPVGGLPLILKWNEWWVSVTLISIQQG